MADRRDGRGRRAARIAPLAGLAGQTSGEAVAVALARKKSLAGAAGGPAEEAERYTQQLSRSARVAAKAGQMLWTATVGSAMPAGYLQTFQEALTGFVDDTPVMPPALTAKTVRTELGEPPQEVFAEFDPTPFATGPVCQVHAAELHDGRQVAVKVRCRGAAQALRSALADDGLLAELGPLVQAVAPDVSVSGIKAAAGELRGRVEETIGLRGDAARQAEFAAAYRKHPFIRVPGVVPELSTQRLLTMDRADGLGLAQAQRADQAARDQWGEVIYRFRVGSVRMFGQANADPGSSGNYLFHSDGGVTFLGFDRGRRFKPEEVAALQRQARAAVEQDTESLSQIHREQCGPGPEGEPERLSAWHHEILRPLTGPQPFTCTPHWADAVAQAALPVNWPCRAAAQPPSAGSGCLFAMDGDTGMASVLGALRATADWNAIREEWDCGGPPATPLGKLESAWQAARTEDPNGI